MTIQPLQPANRRFPLLALLLGGLPIAFLAVEFIDELVYGAFNTAWPAIQTDLGLTYVQIGILIGLPLILGNLLEPVFGLFGDLGHRRVLILAGCAGFVVALLVSGIALTFLPLLAAAILLSPSSGALVGLSQASLMDFQPERREQSMARWTLAGSLGVVAGPLLLIAILAPSGSWRPAFLLLAVAAVLLGIFLLIRPIPHIRSADQPDSLREAILGLVKAFRMPEVWRWLILLTAGDLMLDVLLGFLALYFRDVVLVTPVLAGVAVAIWTGVGFLGDLLIIPLLERVDGVRYLRLSACGMLVLYAGFLLVPWLGLKLILLAGMGLLNAGWFAIPQARLYGALPGRSGLAMAVGSLFGIAVGFVPVALGWLAQTAGLGPTMWLLIIGPVGLILLLPRSGRSTGDGGEADENPKWLLSQIDNSIDNLSKPLDQKIRLF